MSPHNPYWKPAGFSQVKHLMDFLTYPKLREHVIEELTKVGGRVKGEEIIVLCPFHNDTNPSLEVHIGHSKMPGIYHCWSCKAGGHWNNLAEALRLPSFDYGEASKITEADNPFNLLSNNLEQIPPMQVPLIRHQKGLEPLPHKFKWRGYGRAFYENLGAKFWWDRDIDMEYLHFPLHMNQEYVGYTLCALKPHKPKYQTFADTLKVLFMYDQIPQGSPVVLVEGHFDTLRLVAEGIPAAGIFGTSNWGAVKRDYVIAKNPPKVLILFDGDNPGYEAAQRIFLDLRAGIDVDIMYLPLSTGMYDEEGKEIKMDPGNMPDQYVDQVRSRIGMA